MSFRSFYRAYAFGSTKLISSIFQTLFYFQTVHRVVKESEDDCIWSWGTICDWELESHSSLLSFIRTSTSYYSFDLILYCTSWYYPASPKILPIPFGLSQPTMEEFISLTLELICCEFNPTRTTLSNDGSGSLMKWSSPLKILLDEVVEIPWLWLFFGFFSWFLLSGYLARGRKGHETWQLFLFYLMNLPPFFFLLLTFVLCSCWLTLFCSSCDLNKNWIVQIVFLSNRKLLWENGSGNSEERDNSSWIVRKNFLGGWGRMISELNLFVFISLARRNLTSLHY
jgi:hypothetical protein